MDDTTIKLEIQRTASEGGTRYWVVDSETGVDLGTGDDLHTALENARADIYERLTRGATFA